MFLAPFFYNCFSVKGITLLCIAVKGKVYNHDLFSKLCSSSRPDLDQ